LQEAAIMADILGLEVHAGHGLTYETTALLAKNISSLKEVNIGHFMIGEAVLHGLPAVIKKMKAALAIAKN
jgi:pyridoxine 5-phosphate synthase